MIDLHSCPLCGGRSEMTAIHTFEGKPKITYKIECSKCGATVTDKTINLVAIKWFLLGRKKERTDKK